MGVDKSPTDTYPMRLPSVGDRLNPTTYENPVLVLACWLMRPSDVDAYAWWLVLCFLPNETAHKFVVWNAYDRPEGWTFGSGDYYASVDKALRQYEARGGQHH